MLTRVITAIVLAAIMALVIFLGPPIIFEGVILLVAMGGLYEFFKLTLPPEYIYREAGWVWGVAVAAVALFYGRINATVAVLVVGLFCISLIHMRHATVLEGVTSRIALTVLGVIYLGVTLPFWGFLRELPHGRALVFMGITAAALSDTFALFVGKAIGRHKMAPLTSPNKTMEGFVAGIVGSMFGVYVTKLLFWTELSVAHIVLLGLAIGFIGPMGDLIESAFKRDYHVKDSGMVIPGHGGILDRLDAMAFTGPFVYLYAKLILAL